MGVLLAVVAGPAGAGPSSDIRGCGPATLRIGAILWSDGTNSSSEDGTSLALSDYVESVNATGGLHGRELDLVIRRVTERSQFADAVRRLVLEDEVFAVVAPRPWDPDQHLEQFLSEASVPVLGPLDGPLGVRDDSNSWVFDTQGSLRQQAMVLVERAGLTHGDHAARVALVAPDEPGMGDLVLDVRRHAEAQGLSVVSETIYPVDAFDARDVRSRLDESRAEWLLFLGDHRDFDVASGVILPALTSLRVLVPSTAVVPLVESLSQSIWSRTIVSFASTLPPTAWEQDLREQASADGVVLADAYGPWSAQGALALFVETARRCGRTLDPELFVGQLESLDEFESSQFAPLTFGPNRRVGPSGVYLGVFNNATRSFRLGARLRTPQTIVPSLTG